MTNSTDNQDMVERCSKAMEQLVQTEALKTPEGSSRSVPYAALARAAIEAMRQPTPAMERALSRSAWHSGSGRQAAVVIADVIDAALNTSKHE